MGIDKRMKWLGQREETYITSWISGVLMNSNTSASSFMFKVQGCENRPLHE
jgi:hypothetical protein